MARRLGKAVNPCKSSRALQGPQERSLSIGKGYRLAYSNGSKKNFHIPHAPLNSFRMNLHPLRCPAWELTATEV